MTRLRRAWQALDRERRNSAVAATALLLSMFLPWYQQNGVVHGAVVSRDLDAFGVFSLIEAVILLAALAVLGLLFARAERRELPFADKDGSIVLSIGSLAALLLFIRLFDKPGVSGNAAAVDVGVEWGIFFALAAAGLLAYSGARLRVAGNEPPLLRGRRARPDGPRGTDRLRPALPRRAGDRAVDAGEVIEGSASPAEDESPAREDETAAREDETAARDEAVNARDETGAARQDETAQARDAAARGQRGRAGAARDAARPRSEQLSFDEPPAADRGSAAKDDPQLADAGARAPDSAR
jgi:hypothetical protein